MTRPLTPADVDDVHTHCRHDQAVASGRAVLNLYPGQPWHPSPRALHSVGIHPWHAAEATQEDWRLLEAMAADPRCVAVGEAGLDALRGPEQQVQEEAFVRQARLAERLVKPLVLHVVRRAGRILELRHALGASVPWIWHGFTGSPELARQAVAAGIDISVNPSRPPRQGVEAVVPAGRLWRETDAPA